MTTCLLRERQLGFVLEVRLSKLESYSYECVSGRHKRRLFGGGRYSEYEREEMGKVKEYLRKKKPHMDYSEEVLLRLCYSGDFLLSEVTERVRLYDEWH